MLKMLSRRKSFCTENLGADCLVGGMCVVEHGLIVFITIVYFIKIFKVYVYKMHYQAVCIA